MSVRFLFAWYDLWVGLYWDRSGRKLYILPVPCFGLVVSFPRAAAYERGDRDASVFQELLSAAFSEPER